MEIRRSKRLRYYISPLSIRLQNLFHSIHGDPVISKKLEKIHSYPNIYRIHDFFSDVDIEYFNKICTLNQDNFESSFMEDSMNNRVISEDRTSTFLHLAKAKDQTIRAIERRAADIVSLSSSSVEPIQIVSYTNGQKFDLHHDAGTLNSDDNTIELVTPRRVVTIFVYLNDLPVGQGETSFPMLGLKIQPVRGSAILFCNLLPSGEPDYRTSHQACPVHGNLWKYGVNIWIIDESLQDLALESSSSCSSSSSLNLSTRKRNKLSFPNPNLSGHYTFETSVFRRAEILMKEFMACRLSNSPQQSIENDFDHDNGDDNGDHNGDDININDKVADNQTSITNVNTSTCNHSQILHNAGQEENK